MLKQKEHFYLFAHYYKKNWITLVFCVFRKAYFKTHYVIPYSKKKIPIYSHVSFSKLADQTLLESVDRIPLKMESYGDK